MTFHEEQTDTTYVSLTRMGKQKDYVAEVFIKDDGFVWHAVQRYQKKPTHATLIRDAYAYNCKSRRPYKPGQACDGSITACTYHLYDQLCRQMGIDPLETYREAYDDHIFTQDQFDAILSFAEWQEVETIAEWNQGIIDLVIESIHEVNMHQLANVLSERMPV